MFNKGRIYYDDRLLAQEQDSYTARNSTATSSSDDSESSFSIEHFSGTRTISTIHVDEGNSLSYMWDVLVTKGNFKIVLVNTQNAMVAETICENSGTGNANSRKLSAGEYRIKIAGDNAMVEGKLSVTQE